MSKFYSPLRYPGGKNCIFPFMAELIHENELVGCSYAEPFAGGAGLALHLLMAGFVSEIHLNDFDHSIYSFWNSVLNRGEEFCGWIANVKIDMETWEWAKNVHSNMNNVDDFELAKATFFLNRANVSGIIMGGPIGGPTQKGKYKINARFNREDLIQRIKEISIFKNQIFLYEMDGIEFLKQINRRRKKYFIYIDPPYVKKGADLYMNFFKKEDHKNLLKQIQKTKKLWLVSYDANDLIINLYKQYNCLSYSLSQCTSNRMGNEILIYPDSIVIESSICKLKSPQRLLSNVCNR